MSHVDYFKMDVENVAKVYKGKPHTCYCGCAGDYFEDKKVIARAIKYVEKNGRITAFQDGIITVWISEGLEYTFYFGEEQLKELKEESQ